MKGQVVKEKKERLREEMKEKELEGATFRPKILKKSSEIVSQRQQRLNAENVIENADHSARFKELYGDALARNVRKKHL